MNFNDENEKHGIDYEKLGRRVSEEMNIRDITSMKLSVKVGIQARTIDEIRDNKRTFVKLDTICAIAEGIGCKVDDLLVDKSECYKDKFNAHRCDVFKNEVKIEEDIRHDISEVASLLRYMEIVLGQYL